MPQPDYDAYRKSMDAQADADEDAAGDTANGDTAAGEFFTAEEIAAYLGIAVDEFFSRAAHGDLRPLELEGKHLYAGKHVRRFLVNLGVLDGKEQW